MLAALVCVVGFCVAGVVGIRAGVFGASSQTYRLAASTSFVLAGVVGGGLKRGNRYGFRVVLGLVFCWFGDVLGPWNFMWGVGAFLLGHCFFIAAFASRRMTGARAMRAAGFYAVTGAALSVWLLPRVPLRDLALVLPYMVVISAMAVMACSIDVRRGGWLIPWGAFLFYVSDIFVARWRFVAQDEINGYVCYPLYYAACMMLALSVSIGRIGPIGCSASLGEAGGHWPVARGVGSQKDEG
jgi:uncharacterized membrane protein YhhN